MSGGNGQKNPVKVSRDVFFVGRSVGDVIGISLRPHILEIDKKQEFTQIYFKTGLIYDHIVLYTSVFELSFQVKNQR